MIGKLTGTLLEKNPPTVLVDCHGVGYEVQVPMSTFYNLPATGAQVGLLTHFIVREDAQLLFGFGTSSERETFRELIKITGVGPRAALAIIKERAPDLEIDGEMHGDTALDSKLRQKLMPNSALKNDANLLVMPNIESANIAYNLVKTAAGNGIAVGPILLGCAKPVHILTPSATVRRIVNMTALCVVDAVAQRKA